MPALHAGRVHKLLPHIAGLLGQLANARRGKLVTADQAQSADHHFGGTFDFGKAGLLEKVRVEQNPQNRRHFIAGFHESLRQQFHRRRVVGRRYRPRRHLRLVGHKEVVKMPGNEPGRSRMGANDIDDVLPVKVAGMPQESLFRRVVILLLILELPIEAAVGAAGNHRGDSPAGKGPGTFPHIRLGIVAHAHGEQLQQLPPPVLVDRGGVIVAVVQPVDHRRIPGQGHQQIPVVAHAPFPEHIDLLENFVEVVNLGVAGGENLMPEQDHLFLKGPAGVDHVVQPDRPAHAGGRRRFPEAGLIAQQFQPVGGRLLRRIQQFLHGGRVAPGRPFLQFRPGRAKAGPPHQMRH